MKQVIAIPLEEGRLCQHFGHCQHEIFLEKFPNRYFATPKKSGAQTTEANRNAGIAAAHQAVMFLKSGDDKYRVN